MPKKNYKLTTAQRHAIARRYAAGEKGVSLAKEFGITKDNVYALAKTRGKHRPRKIDMLISWTQRVERLLAAGKITGVIPRIAAPATI